MVKILLMEDDIAQSFEMSQELFGQGYDVHVCASAADAREELQSEPYDLVISDVVVREDGKAIPDGGISLVGWIRHSDKPQSLRRMPVIMITGTSKKPGMQYILKTAEIVGADIGMEKPIDMAKLLTAIRKLTDRQEPPEH